MSFVDERDYEEERANEELLRDGDYYIVCPDCHGEGKHALHGIALTSADIEEAGGQEFLDEYMAGTYDTLCETCQGKRVIKKYEEEAYRDAVQERHTMRMESGIWDY